MLTRFHHKNSNGEICQETDAFIFVMDKTVLLSECFVHATALIMTGICHWFVCAFLVYVLSFSGEKCRVP